MTFNQQKMDDLVGLHASGQQVGTRTYIEGTVASVEIDSPERAVAVLTNGARIDVTALVKTKP